MGFFLFVDKYHKTLNTMKLPFEEWTNERRFSNNVSRLLSEAFICYRNTAYRASLLFSYLAFLTILKELIIKSTKPVSIVQGRWDAILGKLQNDSTWEETVFQEIVNNSSPIFNINDDIRQQVKYWKDRRNDCAHFKLNEIESHHTEAFWSFTKSNLLKITIEGGKDSLLNKFEQHFDRTITPAGADVMSLVREIDDSVDMNQMEDFWVDLINKLDHYGLSFHHESNATKVINRALEVCSERTVEYLSDFLKESKYDLTIIFLYPDKINRFIYSAPEIRSLWQTRIWQDKTMAFSVYGTLLRNSLIPQAEIAEANNHVIDRATDNRPRDESTHLALAGNGFGDLLFEIAIKTDRLHKWYEWVNPHADMLTYYIEKYPLRKETVEVVCEMYTRSTYSHWLSQRIETLFQENAAKKQEFHTVATANNFQIPTALQ